MRTVDVPDALFRRAKAQAALGGSSLKDLILRALEREIGGGPPSRGDPSGLAHIKSKSSRKLDLSTFDFDELILG